MSFIERIVLIGIKGVTFKLISIVIPTCNRVRSVVELVSSINEQTILDDIEILILIDAKDTSSFAMLTEYFKHAYIRVLQTEVYGVNSVRNFGISVAKGTFVYFLDDDCLLPDREWLSRLQLIVFREKAVGGAYSLHESAGYFEKARHALTELFLSRNNNVLLGGNSGYSRDLFLKYGIFDESISQGSEEIEFQERLKNQRFSGFCLEKGLTVIHKPLNRKFTYLIKRFFYEGAGMNFALRRTAKRRRQDVTFKERIAGVFRIIKNYDLVVFIIAAVFSVSYFSGFYSRTICIFKFCDSTN